MAVVADGTNTNTGWRSGFIALVERDLKRNLLWLICQAHGNELPLRHLFAKSDGGHGTSGPLGKEVAGDVHVKNVVKFNPISSTLGELSPAVWKDLSRDQQLLYRYTRAVHEGLVPENLVHQVAGPINHSRWLTLAIRILQLYTRTTVPDAGLMNVTRYIVQVYSPVWFKIKKDSKFVNGPSNIFSLLQLVKLQPEEVKTIVKPVIQNNAYFAESGILLCAMLESSSESVRQAAVKKIREIRENPPKKPRARVLTGIRKHIIPELQWEADSWDSIIDWNSVRVHEPQILSDLSLEELESAVSSPITFPELPVHSQSVERAVKLVTEASSTVCGEDNRHKWILSVNSSRKARKQFDSKKDYKIHSD